MAGDPESFIRANTILAHPPLVPELKLHLATAAMALWEMTEAELDKAGLAPPFWASAAHVAANEVDPFAGAAIAMNAAANQLGDGLEVVLRDMLDEPVLADDGAALWDVVLAGDICYERPMAGRLFAWLQRHADAGALVLIGDPGRTYVPVDGVREVARYAVPTPLALEDQEIRDTVVLRVVPRA
jgi:predicted nicotinamide N-methyase